MLNGAVPLQQRYGALPVLLRAPARRAGAAGAVRAVGPARVAPNLGAVASHAALLGTALVLVGAWLTSRREA